MSVGSAALLSLIVTSTCAAGIGASPASTLPSDSIVACGKIGSNGPIVAFAVERFPNTVEKPPCGAAPVQLSTASKFV